MRMMANNDQSIGLDYFTQASLRHKHIARSLLSLLYDLTRPIAPQALADGQRWISIGPDSYEVLVSKWEASNNNFLRRNKPYRSELAVSTGFPATGRYDTLSFWVDDGYFA